MDLSCQDEIKFYPSKCPPQVQFIGFHSCPCNSLHSLRITNRTNFALVFTLFHNTLLFTLGHFQRYPWLLKTIVPCSCHRSCVCVCVCFFFCFFFFNFLQLWVFFSEIAFFLSTVKLFVRKPPLPACVLFSCHSPVCKLWLVFRRGVWRCEVLQHDSWVGWQSVKPSDCWPATETEASTREQKKATSKATVCVCVLVFTPSLHVSAVPVLISLLSLCVICCREMKDTAEQNAMNSNKGWKGKKSWTWCCRRCKRRRISWYVLFW